MTTYEELLAEYDTKLFIEERRMTNSGLYCDNVIWLNDELTEPQKLCVLAEEIGHYSTTVGDILNTKDINNAKQEFKARKWAYDRLLSIEMIIEAAGKGYTQPHEIAEYLNVDEKFLRGFLELQGIVDISL